MNNIQPEQMPVSNSGATPAPSAPNHTRRNWLIIAGIVVLGLCGCTVLCGALFGSAIIQASVEQPKVAVVIDEFMVAMTNKDTGKAYALFSPRAQTQTTQDSLEKMLTGNNYILFKDYKNVEIVNMRLGADVNTNPNTPQGTVATVQGNISYTDGTTGNFNAVLEKDNGEWRLFGINVTVPPDKLTGSP